MRTQCSNGHFEALRLVLPFHSVQHHLHSCSVYSSVYREEYVLLQPKHVLPEFFMHTRFPYPSGAAGQDGTSPSKRDAARMANAKKEPRLADEMFTCSTKSTVESDEPAFPLENLLLHNAIECREAATASIGDALDSTTEANSSNSSSSNSSPGHGLLKKEAIVKRLHTTVQDFRARSNKEIAESVRSLAHSLAIQL